MNVPRRRGRQRAQQETRDPRTAYMTHTRVDARTHAYRSRPDIYPSCCARTTCTAIVQSVDTLLWKIFSATRGLLGLSRKPSIRDRKNSRAERAIGILCIIKTNVQKLSRLRIRRAAGKWFITISDFGGEYVWPISVYKDCVLNCYKRIFVRSYVVRPFRKGERDAWISEACLAQVIPSREGHTSTESIRDYKVMTALLRRIEMHRKLNGHIDQHIVLVIAAIEHYCE